MWSFLSKLLRWLHLQSLSLFCQRLFVVLLSVLPLVAGLSFFAALVCVLTETSQLFCVQFEYYSYSFGISLSAYAVFGLLMQIRCLRLGQRCGRVLPTLSLMKQALTSEVAWLRKEE